MKLIVGLGNPAPQYFRTRHNAGRLLVEHIAGSETIPFELKKPLKALLARLKWGDQEILLALPATYMNVSGEAVAALIHSYAIDLYRDLLIVVDDMALPFGRLRLRPAGSHGGHNGLRSVEEQLRTESYPRLRIGIGHPGDSCVPEQYVLAPFSALEEEALTPVFEAGLEACRIWATESVEKAMNIVNPRE